MTDEGSNTITREELEKSAATIMNDEEITEIDFSSLLTFITIAQYWHDILLNELERRGELSFHEGRPMVPYMSEHVVQTALTNEMGGLDGHWCGPHHSKH